MMADCDVPLANVAPVKLDRWKTRLLRLMFFASASVIKLVSVGVPVPALVGRVVDENACAPSNVCVPPPSSVRARLASATMVSSLASVLMSLVSARVPPAPAVFGKLIVWFATVGVTLPMMVL